MGEPGNAPFVQAELAPGKRTRFLVDTGLVGLYSGSIGPIEGAIADGDGTGPRGRQCPNCVHLWCGLPPLASDERPTYRHFHRAIARLPRIARTLAERPRPAVLVRFAATFDFPGRKVYLRKSAHFGHHDLWNATGVHLRKRGGLIEIAAVNLGIPVCRRVLKSGDVLVEIDGQSAAKSSLLRCAFHALWRWPTDMRGPAQFGRDTVEHQPTTGREVVSEENSQLAGVAARRSGKPELRDFRGGKNLPN